MAWPSTVIPGQNATANQYNAVVGNLQTWGGDVDAAGHVLKNVGGLALSGAVTIDATQYPFAITGGMKVTAALASNVGITVSSADAARTVQLYAPPAGGSAPAIFSSTSNFAIRTTAADTRAIVFSVVAGAEEFISTTSGRLRVAVPLDADSDVISGGKVQGASLTVTNAANISFGGNWANWTPTLTASGSMTISGVTITDAQYLRVGPLVFFKLVCAFTLGGTLDLQVNATPPVPVVGVYSGITVMWAGTPTVSYLMVGTGRMDATAGIVLRPINANVFPAAGTHNAIATGFYRCA
jgi:hypothetical protein